MLALQRVATLPVVTRGTTPEALAAAADVSGAVDEVDAPLVAACSAIVAAPRGTRPAELADDEDDADDEELADR